MCFAGATDSGLVISGHRVSLITGRPSTGGSSRISCSSRLGRRHFGVGLPTSARQSTYKSHFVSEHFLTLQDKLYESLPRRNLSRRYVRQWPVVQISAPCFPRIAIFLISLISFSAINFRFFNLIGCLLLCVCHPRLFNDWVEWPTL